MSRELTSLVVAALIFLATGYIGCERDHTRTADEHATECTGPKSECFKPATFR